MVDNKTGVSARECAGCEKAAALGGADHNGTYRAACFKHDGVDAQKNAAIGFDEAGDIVKTRYGATDEQRRETLLALQNERLASMRASVDARDAELEILRAGLRDVRARVNALSLASNLPHDVWSRLVTIDTELSQMAGVAARAASLEVSDEQPGPVCSVPMYCADALGISESIRAMIALRKIPTVAAPPYLRVAKQLRAAAEAALFPDAGETEAKS